VLKFWGILFTPTWNTAVLWYAAGTLNVSVPLCIQNVFPPHPKPLQKPWFICRHIANCTVLSASSMVWDTALLIYFFLWSWLWVEISTLAYITNRLCWPLRLSVAYCTHIIQTKLTLKKLEISTKIDVYSYSMAHRHASCSVGVICRGCGVVTFNIQSSIY
jgi:hypothetical protein